MIITSVAIFETPLDPNYRNVIDFINLRYEDDFTHVRPAYLSVLKKYYHYQEFELGTEKSIKTVGHNATITIPDLSRGLRNYNYACLYNEGTDFWEFYFITDITSQNDGDINSRCVTLTLKYDSWANNLHQFYNKCMNVTTQRHYDRVEQVGNNLRFKYFDVNIEKLEEIITYPTDIVDRYQLLSLALVVNENVLSTILTENAFSADFQYKAWEKGTTEPSAYWDRDDVKIYPIGTLKYKKGIFYIPLGLYDTSENRFIQTTIYGQPILNEYIDSRTSVEYYERIASKSISIDGCLAPPIKSSWVDRAYLTFNLPFYYNVTQNGSRVDIAAPVGLFKLNEDFDFISPIICYPYNGASNPYSVDGYLDFESDAYKITDDIVVGIRHGFSYVNPSVYNPTLQIDNEETEAVLQSYPFKYLKASFSNGEVDLKPQSIVADGSYTFRISYETSQPTLEVWYYDPNRGLVKIFYDTNTHLHNSGDVTYSKSALEDYQIRNGSQMKMAINSKVANGIVSVITSNNRIAQLISSSVDVFMESYAIGSKIKDLRNTPSEVNSSTGEDDIIKQDRIVITQHDAQDTRVRRAYRDLFFTFGYSITETTDIFEKTRLAFDYVRTADCYINVPLDEESREELQNAFDKGITKQHVIIYENDYIMKNPTFSRDTNLVNNIEHKFVTDPSYSAIIS